MGWDTVGELVILGVVVAVLLYGISWWRGRRGVFDSESNDKVGFFRLVNRKVGGLFSKAVK